MGMAVSPRKHRPTGLMRFCKEVDMMEAQYQKLILAVDDLTALERGYRAGSGPGLACWHGGACAGGRAGGLVAIRSRRGRSACRARDSCAYPKAEPDGGTAGRRARVAE